MVYVCENWNIRCKRRHIVLEADTKASLQGKMLEDLPGSESVARTERNDKELGIPMLFPQKKRVSRYNCTAAG
jgi:hypothetical protein